MEQAKLGGQQAGGLGGQSGNHAGQAGSHAGQSGNPAGNHPGGSAGNSGNPVGEPNSRSVDEGRRGQSASVRQPEVVRRDMGMGMGMGMKKTEVPRLELKTDVHALGSGGEEQHWKEGGEAMKAPLKHPASGQNPATAGHQGNHNSQSPPQGNGVHPDQSHSISKSLASLPPVQPSALSTLPNGQSSKSKPALRPAPFGSPEPPKKPVLDDHARELIGKQIEITLLSKRSSNPSSKEQPVPELSRWECWAASKAEYIKNKDRIRQVHKF